MLKKNFKEVSVTNQKQKKKKEPVYTGLNSQQTGQKTRERLPVSSLANYGFRDLLNIFSQCKHSRIDLSPFFPPDIKFWASAAREHISVTQRGCWFTRQDEYQVSRCTYGNHHIPCLSLHLTSGLCARRAWVLDVLPNFIQSHAVWWMTFHSDCI